MYVIFVAYSIPFDRWLNFKNLGFWFREINRKRIIIVDFNSSKRAKIPQRFQCQVCQKVTRRERIVSLKDSFYSGGKSNGKPKNYKPRCENTECQVWKWGTNSKRTYFKGQTNQSYKWRSEIFQLLILWQKFWSKVTFETTCKNNSRKHQSS